MIEELDQLSLDSLLTANGRASTWLPNFPSVELLQRINNAARKVLFRLTGGLDPDEALEILVDRN